MNTKRIQDIFLQLVLQPRNLAKSLSKGLTGAATANITVISLDGQWLKLLQTEGGSKNRKIGKIIALAVQGMSAEEVQKTIKELCEKQGIIPQDVFIANPTHLCTVRLFSLPSTDPNEIREIVDLQAEKHTPYAKEEILSDFNVLETQRNGYSRILLVIAHQDVINRSVRMVESCQWTIERVGCELEGLISWFHKANARGVGSRASQDMALLVDVDGNTTTLAVMRRGQPIFQRSLATGVDQLVEDPLHAGDRLVLELQRSIDSLDIESGSAKIQEIIISGPVEHLEEFKAQIERGLNLPVRLISSWKGYEFTEDAQESITSLPAVSFAALAGLLFNQGGVNLTPQATKFRQAFEARARALVVIGCQVMAALVLATILFIGKAQKEERYYNMLQDLYEEVAPDAIIVEEALWQIELVEERLKKRGELIRAVEALARLSLPEIRWNSLSFREGEAIILDGTSDQLPKVYEFAAGLSGSVIFGDVVPRRVNKRRLADRDVTDFEIYCPLSSIKIPPGV